jgi:hypothetical protein
MSPARTLMTLASVAACTAAAGLPAAAGAQATGPPLVELQRTSPVREHAGRLLLSRWDGSAYRLSTWSDGTLRDLPVRPQAEPFDADVGPDTAGDPAAVVSVCDASCDLFVVGLEDGAALRPVRNANTTGSDETDPSIWKGRLVFARSYGKKVVPYTKLLQAPRSRPSSRLATLPDQRCGAVDPPDCRDIEDASLAGMELWGRWVAQSWTYQPDAFPGFRQNEIRLTDVARTDTRQVAAMVTGLGGQTYLGPSIAAGRVAFFRACQGDPAGCSRDTSGAIRYRISSGAYELAGANEGWSSWAWTGDAALHVPSPYACSGGDPGIAVESCGIHVRRDLGWRDVDEERIR